MSLVAFLASSLGPRVAAACAHASLASLCKDSDNKQGSSNGGITSCIKIGPPRQHGTEGGVLPVGKVRAAAKDGLDAAATKAKLFADHEEREIQRLSANIVNHQLKRLELKLKQFAEIETLLTRECEQMERARQRIAAERAHMMSPQFGTPGVPRATSLSGTGNPTLNNNNNNTPGNNSRQQHVPASQQLQPFGSGYGSNQQIHPHMLMMMQQHQHQHQHQQQQQQQQQQQHGMMYGLSPRLPLSSIHPPSSTSNAMFGSPTNSQPSLGHPMLRPMSGTKSGLG